MNREAKRIAALARQEVARDRQPAGRAKPAATASSTRPHRLGVRITSQANNLLLALLHGQPGASVADIIEAAILALARERRATLERAPDTFKPKRGRPYRRE